MVIGVIRSIKDRLQGKLKKGEKRSTAWPKVRKQYLEANPRCAVCGGSYKLEIHHLKPFHLYPELELDPNNLVALCEAGKYGVTCHLLVGHSGYYRRENPHCKEDIEYLANRLKSDRRGSWK